jgi:hypothetical protein
MSDEIALRIIRLVARLMEFYYISIREVEAEIPIGGTAHQREIAYSRTWLKGTSTTAN